MDFVQILLMLFLWKPLPLKHYHSKIDHTNSMRTHEKQSQTKIVILLTKRMAKK